MLSNVLIREAGRRTEIFLATMTPIIIAANSSHPFRWSFVNVFMAPLRLVSSWSNSLRASLSYGEYIACSMMTQPEEKSRPASLQQRDHPFCPNGLLDRLQDRLGLGERVNPLRGEQPHLDFPRGWSVSSLSQSATLWRKLCVRLSPVAPIRTRKPFALV